MGKRIYKCLIICFFAIFILSAFTEKKQKVYLTFDDGPGKYTDDFLELFDKYNIKVTYFVTYDSEERRDRIKKIYDKGHTIAVHSYKHKPEIIYLNEEAYVDDLRKIEKEVVDITGKITKYVRFPFGSSNTISKFNKGIMTRLTKLLEANGFKYFDWNIYGDDARSDHEDPDEIYEKIIWQLKNLSKDRDATILCLDPLLSTYQYMEKLIPYLLDNGYEILPIDDTTKPEHHRVAN